MRIVCVRLALSQLADVLRRREQKTERRGPRDNAAETDREE